MDQLSHRYREGGAGLRATWSSVTSSQAEGTQFHSRPPHPSARCPSWGPFRTASTGSSSLRSIPKMGHAPSETCVVPYASGTDSSHPKSLPCLFSFTLCGQHFVN